MKLRIKGNSLRFRVTQSELARLVEAGRVEETIYFSSQPTCRLTYALERQPSLAYTTLRYEASEVTIILSADEVSAWGENNQVGIYATIDLGVQGLLDILIEKDYACLDLSDADNADTFPNPNAGAIC